MSHFVFKALHIIQKKERHISQKFYDDISQTFFQYFQGSRTIFLKCEGVEFLSDIFDQTEKIVNETEKHEK